MRRTVLSVLLLLAAGAATAQSADPLPGKLAGHWSYMGPDGVFIDTVSIAIDGNGQPGPVTGRVTFRGVNCGAQDEPFTGTWDGSELLVETVHRANVNTRRMGGQCSTGHATYLLRRKPGEKAFEGDGHFDGTSLVVTISLSP